MTTLKTATATVPPLNPWTDGFERLYRTAKERYLAGAATPEDLLPNEDERTFLAANGLRPINLFDYIEDVTKYGEPGFATVLLIASARREFFLLKQGGQWPKHIVSLDDLPPKTDEVEGIVWLPRIIRKAQAFLAGALAEDIMYCCGGDRKFFTDNQVNPVDFLRVVEAANGNDQTVIDFVKDCRAS